MKKIFTLISMMVLALSASAETYTDAEIDNVSQGIYCGTVEAVAGQKNAIKVKLRNNLLIQSIGLKFTMPSDWTIASWEETQKVEVLDAEGNIMLDDDFNPIMKDTVVTVYDATMNTDVCKGHAFSMEYSNGAGSIGVLATGSLTIGQNKKGSEADFVTLNVSIPEGTASGNYQFTTKEVEFSNKTYKGAAFPVEGKFAIADEFVVNINVTGADAIANVAADGTEAAAVAKKVVDGQLVIETANGTFNAAGAQVK